MDRVHVPRAVVGVPSLRVIGVTRSGSFLAFRGVKGLHLEGLSQRAGKWKMHNGDKSKNAEGRAENDDVYVR
jgi:hypothetical protein